MRKVSVFLAGASAKLDGLVLADFRRRPVDMARRIVAPPPAAVDLQYSAESCVEVQMGRWGRLAVPTGFACRVHRPSIIVLSLEPSPCPRGRRSVLMPRHVHRIVGADLSSWRGPREEQSRHRRPYSRASGRLTVPVLLIVFNIASLADSITLGGLDLLWVRRHSPPISLRPACQSRGGP